MPKLTILLLAFLLMTHINLLAGSRLRGLINTVAVQGILIGLLLIVSVPFSQITLHILIVSIVSCIIKGIVLPRTLLKAVDEIRIRREVEPFIGYTASMLIGLLMGGITIWICARVNLPKIFGNAFFGPVALFTIMVGLFLLVSRSKAITQVLGYLVLENGIFVFGVSLGLEQSLLVELGILLDVFVGVFAMGIATHYINYQFNDIDTDNLNGLKG